QAGRRRKTIRSSKANPTVAVRADRGPAARAGNRIASRNGRPGSRKWKLRCTANRTREPHSETTEELFMTIQGQNPITDPTAMTNQVASSTPTNTATSSTATPSIDGLATENTFLQLLVAQIKNQDPTN